MQPTIFQRSLEKVALVLCIMENYLMDKKLQLKRLSTTSHQGAMEFFH